MNFWRFVLFIVAVEFLLASAVYFGVKFAIRNFLRNCRIGIGIPPFMSGFDEESADEDSDE